MPYQFRGFGARGRVVFSPNQAVWQANQPTITQVVFASGDPSPEVEVSANTDSIIEVTLASDLVGTITIEGVDYHIEDNSGTVVFASGQPEEHIFTGVNDFTIVSGAITENEYQVIYLGAGSIIFQVRSSKFKYVPPAEPTDPGSPGGSADISDSIISTYGNDGFIIRNDGTLWKWGDLDQGIGGEGSATESAVSPSQLGTDTDWQSISNQFYHSLALKTDGSIWGWGRNIYGSTGHGTASGYTLVPTKIGTDSDWVEIGTVFGGGIALKSNGTLWSWGYNGFGATGQGTTSGNTLAPTQIGTDTDWSTIMKVGRSHTFAIKTDGTLWTWGSNGDYRTGLGTDSGTTTTPTQVGTDTDWSYIGNAMDSSSFAIKTDGTLWAWGLGNNGILGLGATTSNRQVPTQVGTDTDWKLVTSHGFHSFALKTDGTLWGTGSSAWGKLGNGTTTGLVFNFTQLGTDTDWDYVNIGERHTTAVKTDGTVWSWGYNAEYRTGLGTNSGNTLVPTQQTYP